MTPAPAIKRSSPAKIALIQSIDPRLTGFAERTVLSLGHRCLAAKDKVQAQLILIREKVDLLIGAIQNKAEDFYLFDFAKKVRPHCRGVAIIDRSLKNYFPELLIRGYPLNLIADNSPLDTIELSTTIRKILSGDLFGMEKYGIPVSDSFQLESASQKKSAIELVRDTCQKISVSPRLTENLISIADELIMNAVFDAPVNKRGKRLYYQKSRAKELPLKPGERPDIQLGYSPDQIALSVSDPFGSFEESTFYRYVCRCFGAQAQPTTPKKTSRLGLFMVFNALSQMVVNVHFQHRTEVIAILDHKMPFGELKRRHHSFHFFHMGKPPKEP